MADTETDDVFSSKSAQFLVWLHGNDATVSDKIQLLDLRHRSAGRGVVAVQDIDEDEELFAIPRRSILTVENSRLPAELRDQINDPWLSLILAMTLEHQAGEDSRWVPYFNVLPTTFDTLMYWEANELSWLKGSAVVDKIGKQTADKTFTEQLIPAVRNHEAFFNAAGLSDGDLLSLFHRMGSTIMAYAFDLEGSTQPPRNEEDGWEEDSDAGETLPKGMIPLADMLNADADRNNAKLFYEEDKVVMKAIKPVKQGEELFNDYGPLPRADLLRRYGYLSGNYAKYDVVEISLGHIRQMCQVTPGVTVELVRKRLQYFEEQGIIDDAYDISRASAEDGPFPEELIILLNGLTLPPEEFEKLMKKDKLPKAELSEAAIRLLHKIISQRFHDYPEFNGENVDILAGYRGSNGNSAETGRRFHIAKEVVFGEGRVLHEAASHLTAITAEGDNDKRNADILEHNDSHRAKRQKTG